MNQEQIQASSKKKVKAIEKLCKQLEIVVSAEQMITPQGFIKQVVYYTDVEQYEMDKEEETPDKEQQPITEKKDEETKPEETKPEEPKEEVKPMPE